MGRILFFGDSLTAGYGLSDPATESFPARIQEKIYQDKLSYQIVNAGISGDTSSGGLGRLDYWIQSPVDVFILELGINDLLRGMPVSSTRMNLNSILKRVRQKHPRCKIAIMGMEVPEGIAPLKLDEFRTIYRELAAVYQAAFVPFFLEGVAGKKHLNLKDGFHPSSNGYEVIANNVWPAIKELLT